MVPAGSALGLPAAVIVWALAVDRLLGDPKTPLHPVALLGRFISWWGRPGLYPAGLQRAAGVLFWVCTAALFAGPFFWFSCRSPWYLYLLCAPFLLKVCFAWRALEEHARAVAEAVKGDLESGREKAALLVSRNTAALDKEQILSAAYESASENITDSIVSPLLFYAVFGLTGAAVYRSANTLDAMLGYRDGRERLGWFSARMDDLLNYIPARITVLLLLLWFAAKGRSSCAWKIMLRDGKNRPGFNGGIVMAAMAGGVGIRFEKPGVYLIGDPERPLSSGGPAILQAVRGVTLMAAALAAVVAGCTLFLLGTWINSMGI